METQHQLLERRLIFGRSYRTYEEWKHAFEFPNQPWIIRSYRTYEEWKLTELLTKYSETKSVLTVPMRNGNPLGKLTGNCIIPSFLPYLWGMETWRMWTNKTRMPSSYRTYEEWKPVFQRTSCTPNCVLTVPMRNGNFCRVQLKKLRNLFLPYLWGMETGMFLQTIVHFQKFLPYLWGMETLLLQH